MRNEFGCKACGGVYFDQMPDRSTYHHSCPPLPPTKEGNRPERLNKRDENVERGRDRRAIGIIAEGDGVVCLSNPKLTEPPWITQLKAKVAKEEAKLNA